jgi:hypothetical protein
MASNDLDVCIAATGVVGRIDLLDQLLRTKAPHPNHHDRPQCVAKSKEDTPVPVETPNSRFIVLPSDSCHPTATKLAERVASVLSFIADTAQ